MKRQRILGAIAVFAAFAWVAGAQTIPDNVGKSSTKLPASLQNVGFEPPLNGQIPLDADFRDESGSPVRLRSYFNGKPVLLAFVYYTCPMLCDQVQLGVVGTLKMISFHPARDYEVVFVSFDPRDTPQAAARKKDSALSHFGRPESAAGWHFLTGTTDSIDALTKAANFRYSFDAQANIFAHASGFMLLTPDGRVSRYFYGVEYPSRDVRLGIVDASAGKIGTPVDRLLLFCFEYNPATARYSATILKIVRLGGIITVFAIVAGIVIFRRRDTRLPARSGKASSHSRPLVGGGSEQGAD
jgi:protein SCO1